MAENMHEETKNEDVKPEEKMDTVSKLFEDRDSESRDRSKIEESKEGIPPEKAKDSDTPPKKLPDKPIEDKAGPSKKEGNLKEGDGEDETDQPSEQTRLEQTRLEQASLEVEALRKKLEKTEKTLAENHKYGRSNAQKVRNALKTVQRFADDGLLAEEEAKELLETLHSEGEETEEEDAAKYQAMPFAPIFNVANKELENILKYTDDEHLQDKVNAFDYFLSVGSKEEIEQVLEDLTELLDDPLKLARKMLSIGQEVYEESYKGIRQAGGFKNYLSSKDQEIEKLQKKIDKLEKKLLQYNDFDKPRYRIDEMGDVEGGKPATGSPGNDTISVLFDERDKVRRK